MDNRELGWPLKPFEQYWYIGSLSKAIRENVKYPSGLPRELQLEVSLITVPKMGEIYIGPRIIIGT